jgi:hypothetical protein
MACIENPFFLLTGTLLFDGKIRQNAALFWFGLRDVQRSNIQDQNLNSETYSS